MALALRTRGWSVLLAGDAAKGDPFPDKIRALGLDFAALPVNQRSQNPLSMVSLFIAYIVLFRRVRPEIFHAFTIKPMIVGLLAAAVARVPVRVATVAGLGHIFLSSRPPVRWAAVQLFKLALGRAHRVIFYNSSDQELFERLGLVRPGSSLLIPGSGVDIQRFAPTASDLPKSRPFSVLFIGRLLREKGVGELLQAARKLRAQKFDVRIELLGDLDSNPSSIGQATIDAAVAAGDVHWHGATDDVRPFIADADAVVLPSYREGIPLALIEAAAMGKPLIATDVPGCRDVVRDGVNGLLVRPRDVDDLSAAIERMCLDPTEARSFGEAARIDAETRFSTAVVSRQVVAEYQRLLRAKGLRSGAEFDRLITPPRLEH